MGTVYHLITMKQTGKLLALLASVHATKLTTLSTSDIERVDFPHKPESILINDIKESQKEFRSMLTTLKDDIDQQEKLMTQSKQKTATSAPVVTPAPPQTTSIKKPEEAP